MPNFNCSCDDGLYYNETLLELRESILIALGFAAQVANPPPGMEALVNNFLIRGQRFLWRRYKPLQTERMFTWTMTPGERFYGILENNEDGDGDEEPCTKKLDPLKVTWAGLADLNGVWMPLIDGIPPVFYTSVNFEGIPSHYQIKQCIEVFPAPNAAYTLRIQGHFGLLPFAADEDKCTIDSELLYMWALANAKNHYGQPDAADVAAQAQVYLRELISAGHGTRRYVPGTESVPNLPQPVFLPLVP